jgi:hypothetical protein
LHPKRAEALRSVERVSRAYDESLRREVRTIMHPQEHGWKASLITLAVFLPLTVVSATVVDVSEMMLRRSSDEPWERAFPDQTGSDVDSSSER